MRESPARSSLICGSGCPPNRNIASRHISFPARQLTEDQFRALFSSLGLDMNSPPVRAAFNMATNGAEGLNLINTRESSRRTAAFRQRHHECALTRKDVRRLHRRDRRRPAATRETMERARESQNEGLGAPTPLMPAGRAGPQRFGLGFELPRAIEPMLGAGSFGHGGAGGRMGFAHPESGIAVAYVCNSMLWDGFSGPDQRWLGWTKALRDAIASETGTLPLGCQNFRDD